MAMEEETLSVISNGDRNILIEGSDSNDSALPSRSSNKRARKSPNGATSKFKGVVQQQNGHWGAQIYANHQRIWLGTFKSDEEAAMAYDSAAIKLRSGDPHRNFPWSKLSVEELNFQNCYSTEAVLTMIKDGTYNSKFADYMRARTNTPHQEVGFDLVLAHPNGGLVCRQLFQKELTPSDVGKLNRLVIPKKFAMKYLPHISGGSEGGKGDAQLQLRTLGLDDVQLVFYDRSMRSWKFRYCYWSSSHSFVFTRGWNRFVKEKELKANDTVAFYMCEYREPQKEGRTFCMIDVHRRDNNGGGLGEKAKGSTEIMPAEGDEKKDESKKMKKSLKLFGVVIG
ncbi:uncharacterized protein J3R85_010727 [Psidium guajava]|nr:uncharacterized protein J3R85_010727 [Psidium guajava]